MKHNVVIMVDGKPVEAVLRIGADEDDDAVVDDAVESEELTDSQALYILTGGAYGEA